MTAPRRVVLDCDTGTDDAVAIMLAALHPALDLVAVTTVWGNAEVDITTSNTVRTLAHVGCSNVPVLAGAAGPIVPRPAGVLAPPEPEVVGWSPHLALPGTDVVAQDQPAAEWLVQTLRAATQPLTLVQTGPLTNLATVLAIDRRLVDAVEEVVVLGGAHAVGNVTPSADRNVWNDPAAAAAVLDAGFERLVLVTLDATFDAALSAADGSRLRALGTPAGTATADLLDERIRDYASLPAMAGQRAPVHDPLAVAYLVDPSLVTLRDLHVAVETTGRLTYGRSVIDVHAVGAGAPNARVALAADRAAYLDLLLRTFA